METVTFTLDGREVSVSSGPYLRDGEPTPEAREFAESLIGQLDDMRAVAAAEYLDTYNETWRPAGQPTLDEVAFCARLVRPSIVLFDEVGAAAVYFGDSGMFAGHWIEVSVREGAVGHAVMLG